MSEPETLPDHVHPEAALLPWFVKGTLGAAETQQVTRHLEACAACRSELDEVSTVTTALTTIYAGQPGPSPKTARSVFDAVAQDASPRRGTRASREPLMDRIDQWFRSLLLPRWVPTLAATILVAQIGLLVWTTMPSTHPDQVTTRSLGQPTARLNVFFHAAATEEQIRSLLQSIHGRIVDGPDPEGLYKIDVFAVDTETGRRKRDQLREQSKIVRSAELEKS